MVEERGPVDNKVLMGTTPNGKEIYMVRRYNATVRYLEFGSGGILPAELEGGFSSLRIAKRAVDAYVQKLERAVELKKQEQAAKKVKKTK